MTEQEIKDKAPSGANLYRLDWNNDPVYYMHENGYMFLWMDEDGWQSSSLTIGNVLLSPL